MKTKYYLDEYAMLRRIKNGKAKVWIINGWEETCFAPWELRFAGWLFGCNRISGAVAIKIARATCMIPESELLDAFEA